jgi:NADP-dependent 3-hydroxy acid dehydrogenase YdfG
MTSKLAGTVALVTGASSGIGEATARRLAENGVSVVLVSRRRDRLEALATEIEQAGGTALAVQADITDRAQAEAAVQHGIERFGRLDILVNNAGLMLLGPVVGADPDEWDRMIALNAQGLLYTTHAALPHLRKAAEDDTRQVADIVNISSIAGRIAGKGFGVYNLHRSTATPPGPPTRRRQSPRSTCDHRPTVSPKSHTFDEMRREMMGSVRYPTEP